MFELATEVLKQHQIDPGSFLVQFVFYRNYSSPVEQLLEHSGWESKAAPLKAFMNRIAIEGGWGNEAIEVALQHALDEHHESALTQIILIGDAPPNTPAEVSSKRNHKGKHI